MKKSLIIANLLGVALALLDISALTHFANGISTLFLNLLKFISLPIVFFSITSTLTSSDHISEVSSLGLRVLKYTLITTIIAASIAEFPPPMIAILSIGLFPYAFPFFPRPSFRAGVVASVQGNVCA